MSDRNFYFIAKFRGDSILTRTLLGARKWCDEIAEREGFLPAGPWYGDGLWSARDYDFDEVDYAKADINTVPIVKAEYEPVEVATHD